jgi:hypothetical protein
MFFPWSAGSLEQMLTESPLALALYGLMLIANVSIILYALLPVNIGHEPRVPRTRPPLLVRMVRRIHRRPTIASTLSR